MAEKIPLKEILSAMDRKDFDWYSKLDDDKKKPQTRKTRNRVQRERVQRERVERKRQ